MKIVVATCIVGAMVLFAGAAQAQSLKAQKGCMTISGGYCEACEVDSFGRCRRK